MTVLSKTNFYLRILPDFGLKSPSMSGVNSDILLNP